MCRHWVEIFPSVKLRNGHEDLKSVTIASLALWKKYKLQFLGPSFAPEGAHFLDAGANTSAGQNTAT